jgi:hypothetical protein
MGEELKLDSLGNCNRAALWCPNLVSPHLLILLSFGRLILVRARADLGGTHHYRGELGNAELPFFHGRPLVALLANDVTKSSRNGGGMRAIRMAVMVLIPRPS